MIDALGGAVSEVMKCTFGGPAPSSWDFGQGSSGSCLPSSTYPSIRTLNLHCSIAQSQASSLTSSKLAISLFISAKRTIARAWKKLAVSFSEVKSTSTTLMIHKKMSSIFHYSHARFLRVWAPVVVLCISNFTPNQPKPSKLALPSPAWGNFLSLPLLRLSSHPSLPSYPFLLFLGL